MMHTSCATLPAVRMHKSPADPTRPAPDATRLRATFALCDKCNRFAVGALSSTSAASGRMALVRVENKLKKNEIK